ncbi:26S proteasome non-ATPase regulatory subunit 10 [Linnemannia hyalina]|uniref:26S proteasome non-ATPase regulatory subunit 10 n=1 Tax=Linnemannia hyalina TaxID=64524 RepID=A0A9P8BYP0_9FUNG|nr:26S proteasome non-ATPase regulatory subunit 10 [Linnemannia hyalina]
MSIHTAALEGQFGLVKQLLEQDKAALTSKDEDERQPLHWAVSGKRLDIVEYLIQLGAPVNEQDEVTSVGNVDITTLLLNKGANVNAKTETGTTPLHYASSKNHLDVARILLDKGADPKLDDDNKQTPLHRAAVRGYTPLTKLLIEKRSRINTPDTVRNTPLHLACQDEHGETALALLEAGADLDRQNGEGQTPFDYCSVNLKAFLKRHGYEA